MSMLLEFALFLVTILGLILGSGSIYWVKMRPCPRRAWWGGCVFILNLLVLGVSALLAALLRADGLAPLGLLAGLLIVAMLWDGPTVSTADESAS